MDHYPLKLDYRQLSKTEKQVVDYASKKFFKNYTFCNGESYFIGTGTNRIDKIYQVLEPKPIILLRSTTLSEADKLNGMTWRGDIAVIMKVKAARIVENNRKYSIWYSSQDIHLKILGTDGGLYSGTMSFYNNELYGFQESKQLTCADVEQTFNKSPLTLSNNKQQLTNEQPIEEKDINITHQDYENFHIWREYLLNLTNYKPVLRLDVSKLGRIKVTIVKSTGDSDTDNLIIRGIENMSGRNKIKRNNLGSYDYFIQRIVLPIEKPKD